MASLTFGATALADPAGDTTDPVTGYRCVSQGCFSVRPPDSDCICVKQNPGEQMANRVVLACSTKQDGRWVACPVKPRRVMSIR
jgi:hypothetical protein